MSRAHRGPAGGRRQPTVRVKSARGRSKSSTRWLQRQLNMVGFVAYLNYRAEFMAPENLTSKSDDLKNIENNKDDKKLGIKE